MPTAALSWAARLKRAFEIDITLFRFSVGPVMWWPVTGNRWGPPTDVTNPDAIRQILHHVQQRGPPAPESRHRPPLRAEPHQTRIDYSVES